MAERIKCPRLLEQAMRLREEAMARNEPLPTLHATREEIKELCEWFPITPANYRFSQLLGLKIVEAEWQ